MALLVQKFGGTSVGSVERIQALAQRISRSREDGHDVVVVVSAMGHTTDELTGLAAAITNTPRRAACSGNTKVTLTSEVLPAPRSHVSLSHRTPTSATSS